MFLGLSFVLTVDLCNLQKSTIGYQIRSVLPCLEAPVISNEIFQQTQKSLENMLELFVFKEAAANPPAEYQYLKVNITDELAVVRARYNSSKDIPAFKYYSDLSQLFLNLKDPHTLFVKSNYFKNFRLRFPLLIEHGPKFFSFKGFANNLSQAEYLSAFGVDL